MKLTYPIVITCLFLLYSTSIICIPQKAVINIPFADLIGQPIQTIYPDKSPQKGYDEIARQANPSNACPRLHQLLYNDIVEIVKSTEDEICLRIAHAYYLSPQFSFHSKPGTPSILRQAQDERTEDGSKRMENKSMDKQTHYWTLKKNITSLDDLTAKNIPISHLPDPINFSDVNHLALNQGDIVTLIEPHYDSTLRITFSAGTRFMRTPSPQKKRASCANVFAIDYHNNKEHLIKIPLHKCHKSDQTKTPSERITDYVNLLKKWSHTKQGFIPYTLGGTSFTHTIQGNFKEITHIHTNCDYSLYEYEHDTRSPKSGFDCSGVIVRAAQICGIPYFCKNTATIPHCLALLKQPQALSNGDLILIRGHVMIVSDIKKNLLIEARSYAHGYGKLHEIPISEVFEDIETYKDLTDAFFKQAIIKRKDKQGNVRDTFANLQLFSMASVWK